jgi:leader peptidase (prepilin peptidase) / N-methyltransferase
LLLRNGVRLNEAGIEMLARWSTFVARTLTTGRTFEAITALVAGALSIAASLILIPNVDGVIGGGLAVLMIAIAVVDSRSFIIPDELTAAALALGFLHAAIQGFGIVVEALGFAALRGAILAFAFLCLRILYRRLRGREGIGLGDVKLAGVAGVWLDWPMAAVAVEIAALAALAAYAVRLFCVGGSVRSTAKLPLGLFFAPAIWLGWMMESTLFVIRYAPSLQ